MFNKNYLLLFLFIAICWYSYIRVPLEEDPKVFLAAARIADQSVEVFPKNVYSSWEFKPIGHRLIVYFFYKVTNLFADYNDKGTFEFILKLIYSIFIILLSFIFSRNLRAVFSNVYKNADWLLLWIITMLAFFTLIGENVFQPSGFGVLIQLSALPLMLSKKKSLNLLAGIPLAILVPLKGISILLSVQLLLFVYLLGKKYRRNLVISTCGFLIFVIGILSVIIGYFPNEIVEFHNTIITHRAFSVPFGIKRLKAFFLYLPFIFNTMPVIYIGIFAFFPVFFTSLKKQKREAVIFLSIWVLSIAYIIIQGKYYAYHYVVFFFPIIASIALLLNYEFRIKSLKNELKVFVILWFILMLVRHLAFVVLWPLSDMVINSHPLIHFLLSWYEVSPNLSINVLIITVFMGLIIMKIKNLSYKKVIFLLIGYIFIIWCLQGSLWGRYTKRETGKINRDIKIYNEVKMKYKLHKEKQILYLTDGVPIYYLDSPSYLRMILPLILRLAKYQIPKNLDPIFINTINKILSYKGKYIVLDPHFIRIKYLPAVEAKIEKEYELIYEDTHIRRTTHFQLYRRKL